MKKSLLFLLVLSFAAISCKDDLVEIPKNLIDKDKMKEIIYDLAVLEAAKNQATMNEVYPKPSELLREKYKVDSLTFAKSSQYYAADAKDYKKMYEEVKERLNKDKEKMNRISPAVQIPDEGIVK